MKYIFFIDSRPHCGYISHEIAFLLRLPFPVSLCLGREPSTSPHLFSRANNPWSAPFGQTFRDPRFTQVLAVQSKALRASTSFANFFPGLFFRLVMLTVHFSGLVFFLYSFHRAPSLGE